MFPAQFLGFADGISEELRINIDHLGLARVISSCFAKDTFQNTDFSHLKCQLKRKKVDTACLKRFSKFQPPKEWVNKL